MIDWNTHEDWLENQVKQLPEWHRVIYATLCSERALPAYEAYATNATNARYRDQAFSELASLRSAMEFVWANIGIATFDQTEAEGHLRTLEIIVEQKEEEPGPWSLWQTHAIDATYVIMNAVNILLDRNNVEEVIAAAKHLYDTVVHFATSSYEVPSQVPFERIKSDPVVQDELERQRRDMLVLSSHKDADPRILFRDLRMRAKNEKILPI
jgi:uncharacterized protein YjaG (DUF416 family)